MPRPLRHTLLLALVFVATDARAQVPVIEPGQEAVIARMLAGTLPEGCVFTGAAIEGESVTGRYDCGAGEVTVKLFHADTDGPGTRTEAFRISGEAAPPALLEAVVASVKAGEGAFHWRVPEPDLPEDDEGGERSSPVGGAVAYAVLLLGSWVGLWVWMRRSGQGEPEPQEEEGGATGGA